MSVLFSLGLDYENQRVYDKVTGNNLIELDTSGGGVTSSQLIKIENNNPVLDLTEDGIRYLIPGNSKYDISQGEDFAISTVIRYNGINDAIDTVGTLFGSFLKEGNSHLQTTVFNLGTSFLNIYTLVTYVVDAQINFSINNPYSDYHHYLIKRENSILSVYIDGELKGSTPLINAYYFYSYNIGLFCINKNFIDQSGYNPTYGEIKSFTWYKGIISSEIYNNIKID